jgi:hypothetical protein
MKTMPPEQLVAMTENSGTAGLKVGITGINLLITVIIFVYLFWPL